MLYLLLDGRHPCLPADEDHLIHLPGGQPGILQRLAARSRRPLNQRRGQGFKLCPRERHGQVLGPGRVRRDERQIQLRLRDRGQFQLAALRRLTETLHRAPVRPQVDALLLEELIDHPVDDGIVEIVAAQMCVARRRAHVECPLSNLKDRDVERPAAEVEDGDDLLVLVVQP